MSKDGIIILLAVIAVTVILRAIYRGYKSDIEQFMDDKGESP